MMEYKEGAKNKIGIIDSKDALIGSVEVSKEAFLSVLSRVEDD